MVEEIVIGTLPSKSAVPTRPDNLVTLEGERKRILDWGERFGLGGLSMQREQGQEACEVVDVILCWLRWRGQESEEVCVGKCFHATLSLKL